MKTALNFTSKIMLIRLFVVLTLLSTFSSEFLNAQISQQIVWTKAYDQVSGTGTGYSLTIGPGSNRILIVGISTTFDENTGSTTQNNPSIISYGGVTLTLATTNGATSGRMHTWLYFLKDNAVMDGTSRPFNVTAGSSTSTMSNFTVYYSVFSGVNQTPATYTTGNNLSNTSGSGPAQLSSAMAISSNEQAVYISSIYDRGNTTIPAYTINTNWTSGGSTSGSNTTGGNTGWKVEVAKRAIPTSSTSDNAATSGITPANSIRYAISAMSLPAVPTPIITSLSSNSGCVGSSLTINGTNLTGATSVTIGGTAATITNTTSTTITVTVGNGTTGLVTVTTPSGTANSASNFTVNSLPAVSFTSQPGVSGCAGVNLTYTTQASMTNYVWGFPGVLNTDYKITSGGTSSSSSVTLQYLTATSKTITVNYTDINGCTAIAPTSSTATDVHPTPTASVPTQTNISCNAGSDGTITIAAADGTSPYSYSVDGGTNWISDPANPYTYGGLKANTPYRVQVKDANGCISK